MTSHSRRSAHVSFAVNGGLHQNIESKQNGRRKHHKSYEIYCHRIEINFIEWHERICPSVVMPSVLFHSIATVFEESINRWQNRPKTDEESQRMMKNKLWIAICVAVRCSLFRLGFGIDCGNWRHENRVIENENFRGIWQQCNARRFVRNRERFQVVCVSRKMVLNIIYVGTYGVMAARAT